MGIDTQDTSIMISTTSKPDQPQHALAKLQPGFASKVGFVERLLVKSDGFSSNQNAISVANNYQSSTAVRCNSRLFYYSFTCSIVYSFSFSLSTSFFYLPAHPIPSHLNADEVPSRNNGGGKHRKRTTNWWPDMANAVVRVCNWLIKRGIGF